MPLSQEKIDTIQSIVVLGWGLIGDLFIRVPVIEALRAHFPAARIVVVVDPSSRQVLTHHPGRLEVIPFSRKKRPRLTYLFETVKNLRYLRKQRFDLCINLYSGGSSSRFTRLIAPRYSLGFNHTPGLRRANNLQVNKPSFCGNWSRALGKTVGPLGIPVEQIRRGTSFYCSTEAQQFAKKFIAGYCDRGCVAFNLGAGAEEKRWPVERFVALAIAINKRYGFIPLVFKNPGMEALAESFSSQYSTQGESLLAPLLALDQVGALMMQCNYVVTGDTSLLHISFGLKQPTLALFTYTRPETVTPEDCPHIVCFVENPENRDACGNPQGTTDIPVDYAMEQFELLTKLNSNYSLV